QHRGALIIRGNFNANITNIDSAYTKEGATGIVSGKFNFAKPLDKKEDSKIVADLVNNFVRESFKILNEHNVNKERIRNGLLPANFIFCRGGGQLRKLKKLHGKWMALGYMPLEIGIANVFRMKTCRFTYPELKGIDVYPNLYEGLKKAIKTAKEMLEKNKNKIDYFYIHFKETDVPGHDGKAEEKIKMIEIIDKEFFSFLKKFIGDNKLIILPDHTTSCKKRAHSFEAVPVLIYPSQIENEKRFIEREGMKGKRVEWDKIIKNNLLK
ncbi:MAG: hypothetical protein QXO70_02900, partial [Candidatus Pacearchaeota archaeon]